MKTKLSWVSTRSLREVASNGCFQSLKTQIKMTAVTLFSEYFGADPVDLTDL